MLLTSRTRYTPPLNFRHQQRNIAALFLVLLCIGLFEKFTLAEEEGDACKVKSAPGVCTPGSKCIGLDDRMKQLGLTPDDVVGCSIGIHEEIVCCPGEAITSVIATTMTTSTTTTTTTTTTEQPQLIINGNELDRDSDYYDLSKLLNGQNRQNGQNNNGVGIGTGIVEQPLKQRDTFQLTPSIWPSNWQPNAQIENPNNNFQNINNNQIGSQWENNRQNVNNNFRNMNNDPNNNFRNVNRNNFQMNTDANKNLPNIKNNPMRINGLNPNHNFQIMNQNPMNNWQPNTQLGNPNNNFQNLNNNPRDDSWRNGPNRNSRNHIPMNNWQPNVQFVNLNNNFHNTNNHPSGDSWGIGPNPNNNFQNTNNNVVEVDRWANRQHHQQQQHQPNSIQWPTNNNNNRDNINTFENVIMEDPIVTVNNKLRNEGLNIVQVTLDDPNWSHRHQPQQQFNNLISPTTTTTTTLPSTFLEDPFQRFQFRPQTFDNDIRPINSNDIFVDPSVTPEPPIPVVKPTTTVRVGDRPAKRACADIEKGLQPLLTPHIIGGTPVGLGEYPHMVAIGFSTIGNEGGGGPYSFLCGGALIDQRFVLTAAHCVNRNDLTPEIVRMGVVNFTDIDQMRTVVELKITETHIHPKYKSSSTYNDISVLELERDVEYTENVYPICLYTDSEDPPENIPLYVSGWGTVNTQTRETSKVLLKARQQIVAPKRCNESYVLQGLNRRISEGIVSTQLCTIDPQQKKDACQGDSGGPLTLVLDEAKNKYSLVGVISAGFSCASSTPGLYSRVSAFLDYIESVVWPTTR